MRLSTAGVTRVPTMAPAASTATVSHVRQVPPTSRPAATSSGRILDDFPEREAEDVKPALRFAAATLNERQVPLLPA